MKIQFFGAPIQLRVIYAVIASLLWWATIENSDWLHLNGESGHWVTGAVFSALVLVPYLSDLKGTSILRALALLFCGGLSYWTAIKFAVALDPENDLGIPAFPGLSVLWMGIAGIVGALIVGIGSRLVIPLALRWRGWLMLAGAGLVGGSVLDFSVDAGIGAWGDFDYRYWMLGHMAWQVLVCVALYYGSNKGRTS